MIYSVTINNKAVVDNELNISLQQAYILSGLHSIVANWEGMSRLQYEGRDYYWLSYSMVVGELPMLRIKHKNGDYTPIKKDTLYGIFKELANEGFLISHPENQKQGRAYYAFSPKMHLLFGKNTARNTCGYKSTPTDINPDTYGYKSLPPTDINPDNNSTKDNNTTDNTLPPKGGINPATEKKQKEDYSEFAAYCQQHGFEHVPKIARLLTKEKVAAKRKEQSALAFYETVAAIDAYLKSVAPKMPYKDLSLVWKQFAFSDGCAYTKNAYNSLYAKIYGKAKESYTKNEIEALGVIWCVLEANTKTNDSAKPTFEQVCGAVDVFFGKFPHSRQNDTDLKLAFIRTDAETIIREIRGQAVPKTGTQTKGGVVVTQELVQDTIALVRQERERKQNEEQLMRDLGMIP